ncbi:MAG: murein hydrolase activator EnvC family protein, partial [Ferrovibrionaceae bacterium]
LPARGRIVGRYGETTESGAPRRGIVIATRAGAQVTAPAAGRVVFAGPFKGYGQLLIIAHSGGYHSLLSGFADIDASVGQRVVAGEPVGRMGSADRPGEARPQDARAGTAGEGGGPGLYVELRHKGEPVNPLPWLAQGDRKANG